MSRVYSKIFFEQGIQSHLDPFFRESPHRRVFHAENCRWMNDGDLLMYGREFSNFDKLISIFTDSHNSLRMSNLDDLLESWGTGFDRCLGRGFGLTPSFTFNFFNWDASDDIGKPNPKIRDLCISSCTVNPFLEKASSRTFKGVSKDVFTDSRSFSDEEDVTRHFPFVKNYVLASLAQRTQLAILPLHHMALKLSSHKQCLSHFNPVL